MTRVFNLVSGPHFGEKICFAALVKAASFRQLGLTGRPTERGRLTDGLPSTLSFGSMQSAGLGLPWAFDHHPDGETSLFTRQKPSSEALNASIVSKSAIVPISMRCELWRSSLSLLTIGRCRHFQAASSAWTFFLSSQAF
jgi:hypothetical protein